MQHFPTLVVGLVLLHLGGPALAADPVETFYASGYTTCDAHVMHTAFAGASLRQTKVAFGHKIMGGGDGPSYVRGRLQAAREHIAAQSGPPACDWSMDLQWSDIEALAVAWTTTEYDAKTKASKILTMGGRPRLMAIVAGQPDPGPSLVSPRSVAFEPEGQLPGTYDACDKRIAAYGWFATPGNPAAEQRFERKVARGDHASIASALETGNRKVQTGLESPCSFHETRYTYDDAVLLAGLWQVELDESKTRIAKDVSLGGREIIEKKLQNLRR